MKTAIINALKTKFEGVSDAILGRVADKLISNGTVKKQEDIADAVAGVTFQSVLESYGDSRANEAQKSAVKNYEDKYKIKDGKPVEAPATEKQEQGGGQPASTSPGEKPKEDTPEWAKQLIQQNQQFRQELDAMKQEKTTNSRQSKLAEVLKNAPEKVRTCYERDFARMSFKDDDEFDGWLTELTPDIEQISADFAAKGGVVSSPKRGTQGGKSEDVNPYLKARVEERAKAETSAPAIQGLTTNQN